jgi:hypothetical protein
MDRVEVDVFQVAQRHSRGLLILTVAAAVSLSACGGGSATPTPSRATATPTGPSPATTAQASAPAVADLGGALTALQGVKSFKFTMTETGGSLGDTLSMLPIPESGIPSFTMGGTVILQPAKAGDVTVKDTLHVISVGGFDYADIGLTGAFTKNDSTTPSLIDSISPIAVYSSTFGSSFDFAAGFTKKGSETKNGVETDFYQTTDAGNAALAELGSVAGLGEATWTGQIWVAKDGGYPVSMTITASSLVTPTSDAGVIYARSFDITKVNDAGNKVTAPTNVTGA